MTALPHAARCYMAHRFDKARAAVFDYNDHLGHENQKQLLVRHRDKIAPGGKVPPAHHWGDPTTIVAIGLGNLGLQHRLHGPGLDTDHRQVYLGQCAE